MKVTQVKVVEARKEMLEDIAVLTGAKVISEDAGMKLEDTTVEMLGQARRVVADKDNTTIVDGKGSEKNIKSRIRQLNTQIEKITSDYDKEKLQERLGKLSGGVAVLKIGAASELEQKEKQHRVEDAKEATRAAIEEGVVAGGGTALIQSLKVIEKLNLKGDEKIGADIVRNALHAPAWQIAQNAGVEGSVIVDGIKKAATGTGYDAITDKFVDMIKSGIVDPLKVTRSALQNASSVAAMILSTEAVVTDLPEKNTPAGGTPPMPDMSGMGGMGM